MKSGRQHKKSRRDDKLTTPQGLMERCILAYLSVQVQSLIDYTGILEYLRSKCLDIFLLSGMSRFVGRIKECLAVKLDSALNR